MEDNIDNIYRGARPIRDLFHPQADDDQYEAMSKDPIIQQLTQSVRPTNLVPKNRRSGDSALGRLIP